MPVCGDAVLRADRGYKDEVPFQFLLLDSTELRSITIAKETSLSTQQRPSRAVFFVLIFL